MAKKVEENPTLTVNNITSLSRQANVVLSFGLLLDLFPVAKNDSRAATIKQLLLCIE